MAMVNTYLLGIYLEEAINEKMIFKNKKNKSVLISDIDGVIFDLPGMEGIKKIENTKLGELISKKIKKLTNLKDRAELQEKLYHFILAQHKGEEIVNILYKKRKPNQPIIDLVNRLKENEYKVLLVTGFLNEEIIKEQLKKHKVKYDDLYVRDDRKKSMTEYKVEQISRLVHKLESKVVIVDDSMDILDALKKNFFKQEIRQNIKMIYYNPKKIQESNDIINTIKNNFSLAKEEKEKTKETERPKEIRETKRKRRFY